MKNKILIVGGDPNSINSEIIYKSWKKSNSTIRNKIYIITNYKLFKKQLSKLKIYIGESHPHSAQNPEIIEIKNLNNKNIIRN